MRLVLLHSPLTGTMIWQQLVPLLKAQGHDVSVADYHEALTGPPPYYEKIAHEIARQFREPSVLIVHSGAGALVPAIAGKANGQISGAVFVDALLPHPGKCWFDTVPKTLATRLRALEFNGMLPPWNRWWPAGALEAMLPDTAMREAFVADLLSLPLHYFEEHAPDMPLPEGLVCAYLQLSPGYDTEATEALRLNWPALHLGMNHLAMLTHPMKVADALEALRLEL